jgi:hypothetical protein
MQGRLVFYPELSSVESAFAASSNFTVNCGVSRGGIKSSKGKQLIAHGFPLCVDLGSTETKIRLSIIDYPELNFRQDPTAGQFNPWEPVFYSAQS